MSSAMRIASTIPLRDGARVLVAEGSVFVDLSGASFLLWGTGAPVGELTGRHRIEHFVFKRQGVNCVVRTQSGARVSVDVESGGDSKSGGRICVTVSDVHGMNTRKTAECYFTERSASDDASNDGWLL